MPLGVALGYLHTPAIVGTTTSSVQMQTGGPSRGSIAFAAAILDEGCFKSPGISRRRRYAPIQVEQISVKPRAGAKMGPRHRDTWDMVSS